MEDERVKLNVFDGRRHPLGTAQNVADGHQVIVDDVRKVIRRVAVRFDNYKVALFCGQIVLTNAVNLVLKIKIFPFHSFAIIYFERERNDVR